MMDVASLDSSWKRVYEENAAKDISLHQMSCWSKQGYRQRYDFIESFLKTQKNVSSVLDVGCGPGQYVKLISELYSQSSVVGVDYAQNVVDLAKKRYPELIFEVASAYSLPYEDKSYDLVMCIGVLQCVLDYKKVISELCRVSAGTILFSTLRSNRRVRNLNLELRKQMVRDPWPTRLYHIDDIKPLFEKNGFVTEVITECDGSTFDDCFFIIATRKLPFNKN